MSYALDLTPEAQHTLRMMSIDLQDLTFDWLDDIAAKEAELGLPAKELVTDFVHSQGGSKHYVFIVYTRDPNARTIWVRSIGYVVRSN